MQPGTDRISWLAINTRPRTACRFCPFLRIRNPRIVPPSSSVLPFPAKAKKNKSSWNQICADGFLGNVFRWAFQIRVLGFFWNNVWMTGLCIGGGGNWCSVGHREMLKLNVAALSNHPATVFVLPEIFQSTASASFHITWLNLQYPTHSKMLMVQELPLVHFS